MLWMRYVQHKLRVVLRVFWTCPLKTTPRISLRSSVQWHQNKATQSVIKLLSVIFDYDSCHKIIFWIYWCPKLEIYVSSVWSMATDGLIPFQKILLCTWYSSVIFSFIIVHESLQLLHAKSRNRLIQNKNFEEWGLLHGVQLEWFQPR